MCSVPLRVLKYIDRYKVMCVGISVVIIYRSIENFFLESNRLIAKITKNKNFLKLVKEYTQIFSECFEQFFDFETIMLFPKLKNCSKRFEKIQTYSLSDSKNFSFLVISLVCSYFLTKTILNLFVKIL